MGKFNGYKHFDVVFYIDVCGRCEKQLLPFKEFDDAAQAARMMVEKGHPYRFESIESIY